MDAMSSTSTQTKAAYSISLSLAIKDYTQAFRATASRNIPTPATMSETSTTDGAALRSYQARIVECALRANTIVLLPTGAGKTWIAADALVRIGFPAVFLVPTIPLVSQQASALRSRPGIWLVGEYHGEIRMPQSFDVLVTTPKAFETAQARGVSSIAWNRFQVVVFDEVHHVIKDHPYRSLALKLRQSSCAPRVIGLTASLTYAVGTGKIARSIDKLCQELNIQQIEHASDDELHTGGYQGAGRAAVAELRRPDSQPRSDLVPYDERKPHLMHSTFFRRINRSTATAFSKQIMRVIRTMEAVIHRLDMAFKSPLDGVSLRKWGEYAHGRRQICNLYGDLEQWYEALRLLVISWEEHEDAAVVFLRMMQCHHQASEWPAAIRRIINDFFATNPPSSYRFDNMAEVLAEKVDYMRGFRGIIFVQQRVMTHILKHVIEQHAELNRKVNAKCLYATKSPATTSLGISKQESDEALRAFSTGEANLLITTSVAEEGLDIPAANCVIYFDPMNHAVSYVQGRGRARQADSSFVMLNERPDRPATLLAQQEMEQHVVASSFRPTASPSGITAQDITAQQSRERGAAKYLCGVSEQQGLGNLNIYCKKTKAICAEEWTGTTTKHCKLTYRSATRSVSAEGTGQNKKSAKRNAAMALLNAISSTS
jgi:ERCC4-related helicase